MSVDPNDIDTQELDLSELQNDPEALKIAAHLPRPTIVKAAVIGVVSLVGAVLGKDLNYDWLNPLLDIYIVSAPAILGLWFHRKTVAVEATAQQTVDEYVGKHRAA